MLGHALPAVLTLFLWWFTTGLILYLDGLRPETFRRSMGAATALLAVAIWGLWVSAEVATPTGAYVAFACGLTIWGWLELSFLTGLITGPLRAPCPPQVTGWPRFMLATRAMLHHELAILAAALATAGLTWGAANQVGSWTVLLLWGMRQSAKLNLFLGVRNLNAEFLPHHLRYLGSYFGRAVANPLLPFSLLGGTAVAGLLVAEAGVADGFRQVAFSLLGTLAVLGVLEHVLMVVPLPATALWGWGFRSRAWSAELAGSCDPGGLERLLHAVARGSYGPVDRLQGVARAGDGWVRFAVAEGRPSLAAIPPRDDGSQRVTAVGQVDGPRLRAAFAACAAA